MEAPNVIVLLVKGIGDSNYDFELWFKNNPKVLDKNSRQALQEDLVAVFWPFIFLKDTPRVKAVTTAVNSALITFFQVRKREITVTKVEKPAESRQLQERLFNMVGGLDMGIGDPESHLKASFFAKFCSGNQHLVQRLALTNLNADIEERKRPYTDD